MFGELDGIANQVADDLADARGIAVNPFGKLRVDIRSEINVFGVRVLRQ